MEQSLLGIRDILVRIRICTSDSFLQWLQGCKKKKKKISSSFFLITYLQAHYLYSSKFDFWLKLCVKFYLEALFQSAQHLYEKKGKYPDPDPYLWLLDPDPGGPKKCGSCGSGSPTLETIITVINICTVLTWRSSCLISSRQAAMYLPSLSRLFLLQVNIISFLKTGFRIRSYSFNRYGSESGILRLIPIRIRIQSGSRVLMTKNWKKFI